MTDETKKTERPNIQMPRQATLAECNRQMLQSIQNERKTVQMVGPAGTIVVPLTKANDYAKDGYRIVQPAKTEPVTDPNAGGDGDQGNGGGDGDVKFTYKDVEYTKEQLLELAQKAELPANVSNPNTIIKRLAELDFDPNAGGDGE